jgi:hypothetical protein
MVAIVLSAGCGGGTPESFWRGLMRTLCEYNAECEGVSRFEWVGECVDTMEEEGIDRRIFADICGAYDSEQGRACLEHLRAVKDSCGELSSIPSECSLVCGSEFFLFLEKSEQDGWSPTIEAWGD